MLEVRNLSYQYGNRVVLDNVSFSLGSNETLGLLGPNGAGKSTLFRLLSGIYPVQQGSVAFEGEQAASASCCVSAKMRAKMGVVFQDASVDDKLSARQNLLLSGELFGVKQADLHRRVNEGLSDVGLLDRAKDKVSTFSGGMRRRLELIRSMLHRPSFMLMDEPSAGLDEEGFRRFWIFCEQMRKKNKVSILLATHRSDEAEKCDRLLILHQGKLIENDTPENIRAKVEGDRISMKLDRRQGEQTLLDRLQKLKETFSGLVFSLHEDEIRVVVSEGHAIIPRLIEALPLQAVLSVQVRRPTLADAYLQITGASL